MVEWEPNQTSLSSKTAYTHDDRGTTTTKHQRNITRPEEKNWHWRGRGQLERKNPTNLNRFGNNQRIGYLENQPHVEATKP
jgi:hypothetical protein